MAKQCKFDLYVSYALEDKLIVDTFCDKLRTMAAAYFLRMCMPAYFSCMCMCRLYANANSYTYAFISFHTAYANARMKM